VDPVPIRYNGIRCETSSQSMEGSRECRAARTALPGGTGPFLRNLISARAGEVETMTFRSMTVAAFLPWRSVLRPHFGADRKAWKDSSISPVTSSCITWRPEPGTSGRFHHRARDDRGSVAEQLPYFAGRGYRVLAVDPRSQEALPRRIRVIPRCTGGGPARLPLRVKAERATLVAWGFGVQG